MTLSMGVGAAATRLKALSTAKLISVNRMMKDILGGVRVRLITNKASAKEYMVDN